MPDEIKTTKRRPRQRLTGQGRDDYMICVEDFQLWCAENELPFRFSMMAAMRLYMAAGEKEPK